MKFSSITIKDIGKALNVSASTVSRALRGSHEINPETKKAIIEYAEKYNYRPNPIAQSLKDSKSRAIGVIVPEIANHFFSQAISGMEAIAYNRGYHVVICQSYENIEREIMHIDHLLSRRVDGLLISLSSQSEQIQHLEELSTGGLPMVFFDRVPEHIATHKVVANNLQGAYELTRHLIFQGFRNIAHLTSSAALSITVERLEGYKKALAEAGLPFQEQLVRHCNSGGMVEAEIEGSIGELLNGTTRPDAIFAASDRLTVTALSILKNSKIKVPEQIGLGGFTNLNVADLLNPSLTSVMQPAFEMGQMSVELLIQLIEKKRPVTKFENKIFNTTLFVRSSSDRSAIASSVF